MPMPLRFSQHKLDAVIYGDWFMLQQLVGEGMEFSLRERGELSVFDGKFGHKPGD
jgi:hypothetical protein